MTVRDLAERFLSEHVQPKKKKSTASNYEIVLNKHVLPKLANLRADKVTTADIAELHRAVAKQRKDGKQPYRHQATRTVAIVSSMYTFAARQHVVPAGFNPAKGVERYREEGRERFLDAAELARLGDAIREAETTGIPYDVDESRAGSKHAPRPENRRIMIGPHAAAALRLLLFTGARLREILHLRWNEIDFERGLLRLADSKTGKKPIILNAPALAILADLPRASDYVIAGNDPRKPRSDIKRPWELVRDRAGLQGTRLHDLRHSFASFGAGAGLGLPVVGRLLGHVQAATTQRYAHLDADPLRRASERIAGDIAAALGEGKAAAKNVRTIRR
jgi:integrase